MCENQRDSMYEYRNLQAFGKVAYINNSSLKHIAQDFLYKQILVNIDLYDELHQTRLEDFCAIVLPMGIDEVYLSAYKDKILDYLHSGGIVLSFMSDFLQILPFSSGYIQSQIPIKARQIRFPQTPSAKIIFDGVREYDINYRRGVKGFFNRGYFDIKAFPHEVEVFLCDNHNQCIGYIDRHSTQGTILSTANADLLSFGLFDNTTARRIGPNLLRWLEAQLDSSHSYALRAYPKPIKTTPPSLTDFTADKTLQNISCQNLKNLIITGGSAFHEHFFTNKNSKYAHTFSKRAHFLQLDSIDFRDFDYIVITSRLRSSELLKHKHKFLHYLQSGGSIVSFGEITDDYLPNICWVDYPVNFWWWLIPQADMPLYALESDGSKTQSKTTQGLFSKIEVNVAKWHSHGVFYPPQNATKILVNELDECLIYKDNNFKGGLYITSLDPEFHLGQGFMPTTEPFFDAFIAWVEEDIKQSPQAKLLRRKKCQFYS